MGHGVGSHGAAIAPAPPAQARGVQSRKPHQRLIERGEIVAQLHLAKMMEGRHGKLAPAIAHAAVVHLEYGETVMCEHLVKGVDGAGAVAHILSVRAAVRIQDQRNLAVDFRRGSGRRQQKHAAQRFGRPRP